MTPPPPWSTLFPYTTLFRSRDPIADAHGGEAATGDGGPPGRGEEARTVQRCSAAPSRWSAAPPRSSAAIPVVGGTPQILAPAEPGRGQYNRGPVASPSTVYRARSSL